MQWLADQSIPVTPAEEGQTLDLGEGATLKLVNLSSGGATLLSNGTASAACCRSGRISIPSINWNMAIPSGL